MKWRAGCGLSGPGPVGMGRLSDTVRPVRTTAAALVRPPSPPNRSPARAHHGRRLPPLLGRDQVERPQLVVVPPSSPVAMLGRVGVDVLGRQSIVGSGV